MLSPDKKNLRSGHAQLNIIGVFLMGLLGFSAWEEIHPLTWASAVPLACISYAAFWIIFELTYNRTNVPSLATSFIGRKKIAKVLRKEFTTNGNKTYHIADLGSGRGQLTRHIARSIPHAQIVGIEMARIPFRQSVLFQRWFGPQNLSYQFLDFWSFDCSATDAIVFYLTPDLAQKVGDKLYKELKYGSLVISHTFPLGDIWKSVETIHFWSPFKEVIHVYRKD